MITNRNQIDKEISTANRRKEIRSQFVVSVELSIFNLDGDFVTERTTTLDISENGCRVATALPLARGDVINVALLGPPDASVEVRARWFEVMWTNKETNPRTIGIKQISGDSLWKF